MQPDSKRIAKADSGQYRWTHPPSTPTLCHMTHQEALSSWLVLALMNWAAVQHCCSLSPTHVKHKAFTHLSHHQTRKSHFGDKCLLLMVNAWEFGKVSVCVTLHLCRRMCVCVCVCVCMFNCPCVTGNILVSVAHVRTHAHGFCWLKEASGFNGGFSACVCTCSLWECVFWMCACL